MTLQKGWLDKQFSKVAEEIKEWPNWMQREAGFQTDQSEESLDEGRSLHCGPRPSSARKEERKE